MCHCIITTMIKLCIYIYIMTEQLHRTGGQQMGDPPSIGIRADESSWILRTSLPASSFPRRPVGAQNGRSSIYTQAHRYAYAYVNFVNIYIYIFIYLYIHIHIKQIYQIYSYNFLHMPNLIKIACLVLDSLLAGHPHWLKETSASSHK